MYEDLRDEGASKQKAARIFNAAARDGKSKVGHRDGKSLSYEDLTVSALKKRAKELGLTNYSNKKKVNSSPLYEISDAICGRSSAENFDEFRIERVKVVGVPRGDEVPARGRTMHDLLIHPDAASISDVGSQRRV